MINTNLHVGNQVIIQEAPWGVNRADLVGSVGVLTAIVPLPGCGYDLYNVQFPDGSEYGFTIDQIF